MDSGWVKWGGSTFDTFKAGNPEDEITGIAVSWMGFTWTLKKALKLNCNMFITNEPTFHSPRDDDYNIYRYETIKVKRQLVEDNELIILRCHDLWDKMPKLGTTDSWAEFLGFKNPIAGEGSYRIFDVSGLTALKVAKKIAKCVKETGQEAIELVGPADSPVSRVAIGAGTDTPFKHFIDKYKVDLVACFNLYMDSLFVILHMKRTKCFTYEKKGCVIWKLILKF